MLAKSYKRGETSRPVQASDITVLVRNRLEAAQVREALQTLGIPSVYLSNRDSVFETLEAQELLWLLQAVLSPERENTLRSALATSMFGLTALDIENLNQDEQAWDALVEEFSEYRQIWRQRGVMPMLRALMTARHIADPGRRAALNRHTAHQRIAAGGGQPAGKRACPGALADTAYRRAGQQRRQPADASRKR